MIKVEIANFDNIPSWYYGYSYRKWDQCVTVFHVIPINFIVRFLKSIKIRWNQFRSKQGWFDERIELEYDKGFGDGYRQCDRTLDERLKILAKKIMEVQNAL